MDEQSVKIAQVFQVFVFIKCIFNFQYATESGSDKWMIACLIFSRMWTLKRRSVSKRCPGWQNKCKIRGDNRDRCRRKKKKNVSWSIATYHHLKFFMVDSQFIAV